MSPNLPCTALAAAMDKTGYSYSQIASQIGSSEQRVIHIFTGQVNPSQPEYDAIAAVLGLSGASITHALK